MRGEGAVGALPQSVHTACFSRDAGRQTAPVLLQIAPRRQPEVMAEEQENVTLDRSEGASATGDVNVGPTTREWRIASMAREGLVTSGWRRNVAATYYIGPPRKRSYGRPCPRCLEPGIVVQAAHARWCKPDSEPARARLAAREERRARRLSGQTEPGKMTGEQPEPRATARRRGLTEEALRAADRRLLDNIRLYEILLQYGPVGTVRPAVAG